MLGEALRAGLAPPLIINRPVSSDHHGRAPSRSPRASHAISSAHLRQLHQRSAHAFDRCSAHLAIWLWFDPSLPISPNNPRQFFALDGGRRTARGPALPKANVRKNAPKLRPACDADCSTAASSSRLNRSVAYTHAGVLDAPAAPPRGGSFYLRSWGRVGHGLPYGTDGSREGRCPSPSWDATGANAPLPSNMQCGGVRPKAEACRITCYGLQNSLQKLLPHPEFDLGLLASARLNLFSTEPHRRFYSRNE